MSLSSKNAHTGLCVKYARSAAPARCMHIFSSSGSEPLTECSALRHLMPPKATSSFANVHSLSIIISFRKYITALRKESMPTVLLVILTALCGFVIGVMSGVIGIGGGSFIIPLLNLGLGLPILNATATSLFTILCSSISGAASHIRNKTCNIKLALALGIPGIICSPFGSILAGKTPSIVLSCITGAILLIPMVQMVYSAIKQRRDHVKDPAQIIRWSETKLDKKTFAICIPGGAIAGFCSGLVGMGGGFIVIPIMQGLLHKGMHEASATSVIFILFSSVAGVITHGFAGDIHWLYGALIAIGSIPGAFLGANFSKKIEGFWIKIIFGIVLLIVSVSLVADAFA